MRIGARRLGGQDEVAPHAGDGEIGAGGDLGQRALERAQRLRRRAGRLPEGDGDEREILGRRRDAELAAGAAGVRVVMRQLELEVLAGDERELPAGAEGELAHGGGQRGAVLQRELDRDPQRQRERHGVADQQRPLLPEADRPEVDRPAGEEADDARDDELLPAPRREGQRLGEHERAEEQERRRPQDLPEQREGVDLDPGRLVLRRGADHGDGDRDDEEHADDPELLGAPQHEEAQHDHRTRPAPACRPTTTTCRARAARSPRR